MTHLFVRTPSGDNDISQNINLLEIESDHSVNDITSALNEPPSPQFQSKKKKKLASGKVPPDTENPSLKYSFSNPKEVQIYRVLGFMTQKLAKAYSFAVCSSTRQDESSFSLPYIRSFSDLSANRDPHFYKHVSGLSDSNLSSYIPSASHHIPRSGSLNNLSMENIGFGTRGFGESKVQIDVSSAHATKRSISTIDLTMTTTHPPTSPPPKQNFGQKVAAPVLHLRNGYEIAQTCRYNAQLAQSLKLASLFHIWTMLAVCFEMLSLAGMEYHPSKVSSVLLNDDNSTKKLESCRRMVISGLSYDWSRHALGRPLLRKIWRTLSHIGDLQTLSTIACTLGGPHATAYYLDEPNKYNPKALDRMLLRYSDILHRWQCHVEATEVNILVFIEFDDENCRYQNIFQKVFQTTLVHLLVKMYQAMI